MNSISLDKQLWMKQNLSEKTSQAKKTEKMQPKRVHESINNETDVNLSKNWIDFYD
jgi:hypothetical protein